MNFITQSQCVFKDRRATVTAVMFVMLIIAMYRISAGFSQSNLRLFMTIMI